MLEDLIVEDRPSNQRGETVDGRTDQVKLSFEKPVVLFVFNVLQEQFYILNCGDLGILHHLIESSPDQGPRKQILNTGQVLGEELGRLLVQQVLHEGVVLVVQQQPLIVLGPIILDGGLLDWK